MTDRDLFEYSYILSHMSADAKKSIEDLRNGDTYDDDHLREAWAAFRGE